MTYFPQNSAGWFDTSIWILKLWEHYWRWWLAPKTPLPFLWEHHRQLSPFLLFLWAFSPGRVPQLSQVPLFSSLHCCPSSPSHCDRLPWGFHHYEKVLTRSKLGRKGFISSDSGFRWTVHCPGKSGSSSNRAGTWGGCWCEDVEQCCFLACSSWLT